MNVAACGTAAGTVAGSTAVGDHALSVGELAPLPLPWLKADAAERRERSTNLPRASSRGVRGVRGVACERDDEEEGLWSPDARGVESSICEVNGRLVAAGGSDTISCPRRLSAACAFATFCCRIAWSSAVDEMVATLGGPMTGHAWWEVVGAKAGGCAVVVDCCICIPCAGHLSRRPRFPFGGWRPRSCVVGLAIWARGTAERWQRRR